MAKSEVTPEEVTSIGTAPAAPSTVFKENAEVVVAQANAASATDTSESAPATAGLVETSETLTLDELRPTSIAEIIEAIELSSGTERLTNDTETSVTDISSKGDSDTAVTASEAGVVDEEPGAAIEMPDVDDYTVYVPVSDSGSVSEAMPLAA